MMQVEVEAPPPLPVLSIPPDPTPAEFEARVNGRRVTFQMDVYFKDAWHLVSSNFCLILGTLLLWTLIFVAAAVGIIMIRIQLFWDGDWNIDTTAGDMHMYRYTWKMYLFDLAAQWVLMMFLGFPASFSAYNAVFNAMRTNGQLKFSHFFSGYNRLWDCMKYSTVYLLLSSVLFLLFWVPGIVFVFFTLFSIPIYVDHQGVSIWKAFVLSKRLVAKYPCSVLGFVVVSALLMILGLLCFGVGILVAFPVVFVAKCFCYHHIAGVKGCPLAPGIVMPVMYPMYPSPPMPAQPAQYAMQPVVPIPSGTASSFVAVPAPSYDQSVYPAQA